MKKVYSFRFVQDGGCTCPGDVAKAIGAGADFVMLGGMLAGHDQAGGEIIEKDGKKRKLFYGMSSDTAMKKHKGGVAEYRYVRAFVHALSASVISLSTCCLLGTC